MPKVHFNKPDEIVARCKTYLEYCIEDGMKPTIAGLGLALGKNRTALRDIVQGEYDYEVPKETREILETVYRMITAETEQFMLDGKINPVAGIFLMRNNMGYTNDEVLTVKAIQTEVVSQESLIAQAQALIEQKEVEEDADED